MSLQETGISVVREKADADFMALERCRRAKNFEESGDFERAREALGDLWQGIGERPLLSNLSSTAQGEVLLRTGALSGWLGRVRQIDGAQEAAKNLLTESTGIFEELRQTEKMAEAQIELAICYWREGGYDEARVILHEVLNNLDENSEQRLRALLNLALVERSSERFYEALRIHSQAATFFNRSGNHALRGKFHNEYATVLKNLGLAEQRDEYIDRALLEYAAASFHLEQAGHRRFQAFVENNLGFLFVRLGKYDEAHAHLNWARSLFVSIKDKGSLAQVDDTRARAFLGQDQNAKAEVAARASVKILEQGDDLSLLAESLTTYGVACARLKKHREAQESFERAIKTAERAGDLERGGIAALTFVEELSKNLSQEDLTGYYLSAEELLTKSQDPTVKMRLGECARLLLTNGVRPFESKPTQAVAAAEPETEQSGNTTFSGCSLEAEVLRFEGNLIRRALEASAGRVTRAARMLGLTHQGLAFILNGRHRDLLSARKPVRRRRKSIIRYR